jgi:hypothetical protein
MTAGGGAAADADRRFGGLDADRRFGGLVA